MRATLGTAAVLALLLIGCAASGSDGTTSGSDSTIRDADERAQDEGGVACRAGTALHAGDKRAEEAPPDVEAAFPWDQDDPTVADGHDVAALLLSSGDPGDGIPAIDAPCFEPVEGGGTWLESQSPVLAVEVGGDARAYPLAILHWHEIVNDVVGGDPVVVTYCPLCNSGLAFRRTVAGETLTFGVSGRLLAANLVMFDRQRKNLWLQFTGEAIAGDPYAGQRLERLPSSIVSWGEFTSTHPDGSVLTRQTGHDRDYDRNPYVGYRDAPLPTDPLTTYGREDPRFSRKSRVVGLRGPGDEDPVAIALDDLQESRMVTVEVAGDRVVVLWTPGQADALDAARIDDGADIGQTGAFLPVVSGGDPPGPLTLSPDPATERLFVDAETGSRWNVLGTAVDGPLAGASLTPYPIDDTFWFAWSTFFPDTEVHVPR